MITIDIIDLIVYVIFGTPVVYTGVLLFNARKRK